MGYIENIKSIMQWGNSFERQGNFPLDRTDLHISYDDAVLYAKGDASDSRKLGKLAYIGQTITVWGLNEKGKEGVWVYSLVPSNKEGFLADLKPVGSTTTETAENYSAAKELSKGLVVGQLIKVTNDEEIDASGDDNDSDVEKIIYKSGFYIVNAPGSISALDTSTGASDEIGAISNRITSLETKVDGDIQDLKDLIDDYSGTLGDVDDRLFDLETFVEAHESIQVSDIENLFSQSNE